MKVLNFGSCNIDYVYSLAHIVSVGETEASSMLEIFPGGKGINQSVAAAKAGVKVYHAGCIGYDGEMLMEVCRENNVDISYVKKVNEKNGHAIIQLSAAGENSIVIYPGSNYMVTKKYIDCVLDNFDKGDMLLLQNEINNVDYIVKKAHKNGMCIIFNPSPYNKEIEKIDLNMVSYLMLNEVEAKAISGCDTYEESLMYIKNKYVNLKIVLTLGVNGCIYADNTHEIHQPAFVVEAVDTTAAGDTFTGYFAAELSKGTDYRGILKIASAASAVAVSKKGAVPSIPDKSEVLSSLKVLKENRTNSKFDSFKS